MQMFWHGRPSQSRAGVEAGLGSGAQNHCCAPSLYVRLLEVDGKGRLVFFAKNDLRCGEELTYDYRCAPPALPIMFRPPALAALKSQQLWRY